MRVRRSRLRIFYGWWIVLAAFLNLFFAVGILFYGFPVFYPSMIQSLGFTRTQLTTGFLLGFVVGALPFGLLAGALIDRLGARKVIWAGVWLVGLSMILMGSMTRLWQFYLLCVMEVIGYTLAGPIPNQVLIANWFQRKRGRAMGYAYLGLGLGGAISPLVIDKLIQSLGWRHALQVTGALVLMVLFPVAQWITKSNPRDLHLLPDGFTTAVVAQESAVLPSEVLPVGMGTDLRGALESRNFSQGPGIFADGRFACLQCLAGSEPRGTCDCWLFCGPPQQEKCDGSVLRSAGCSYSPAFS